MPLPKMLLLRHAPTVTTTPKFLNLGKQAYEDTYEQMRSLVQGESFNAVSYTHLTLPTKA